MQCKSEINHIYWNHLKHVENDFGATASSGGGGCSLIYHPFYLFQLHQHK
ncbi:hypothetical protein Hanom_Chr05g00473281 [Helianthus anomalus]